MENSGVAVANAAAQVREILIGLAAARLNLPADALKTRNGSVVTSDGRSVGYGELVEGDVLHVPAKPQSNLKDPKTYTIVGRDFARLDIPAKVAGGVAYVQDLRLPGMVHARVVRPPNYHARLADLDTREAEKISGLVKIVRDGSYLAVVAEREEQAIRAMLALAAGARWDAPQDLPDETRIHAVLQALPSEAQVILDAHADAAPPAKTLAATFRRPYQMHGPIGPSCAVALFKDGSLTLWSHTQGVFPLRAAVAELLGLPPEQVRVIHQEGSGCYGHDGADDAGADAALIARAVPGRPVRIQWMRDQEHGFEPYGPAMTTEVRGSLDASGKIVDWQYAVWSNEHSTRPGGAGNLMPGWLIAKPFAQPVPKPIELPAGGGDRNALPLYKLPNAHIVYHFIPAMPIRVSALRSLGAYANVFSIESFMDELAAAANADPVAFRLAHLDDERGRDVIALAAQRFGWSPGASPAAHHGRGFAFARYRTTPATSPSRSRSPSTTRPARSASSARSPPPTAGRPSTRTASATRWRAASSSRQAGRSTRRSASPPPRSPLATGAATRFCASTPCPSCSRSTSSTVPALPSSAPAKPRKARPPQPSPMRSPTPPVSGCATCRSRQKRVKAAIGV